jgi:predicted nucleic acid-binding Zn ribbon protein
MKVQRRFCPTHGSVLAVKNTHRLRNAAMVVLAAWLAVVVGVTLAVAGAASLGVAVAVVATGVAVVGLGSKVEPYMCPACGGPVKQLNELSWQEQEAMTGPKAKP